MDVLADIFETIQLRGSFYFRTDFSPPWGATVPPLGRAARFHYVVQGRCWVRVGDMEPVELSAGDFVLVPNGASHILSHAERAEAPPLETVLEAAGYRGEVLLAVGRGDPTAATQLVCGHLSFGASADHAVLRALPPLVRITSSERVRRRWFDRVLQLLVDQVFDSDPGSIAVVTRLSEILFIEAIRFAGDEAPDLRRLMEAFGDTRIGRAVALIHRDPGRAWTVDGLAREVGMSRTRFARRFQTLIGMGPVGYLTEWRLQRGVAALTTSRRTVSEIANACGYASPAAFTRAFADRFGETPKQFRKRGVTAA
ncbi:MAG: AraC family transcriptional regulator [Sphingomonadaceae bacterium]|nr:AraC family transcriptional regulator [Sphingomonadaceae bacterium]